MTCWFCFCEFQTVIFFWGGGEKGKEEDDKIHCKQKKVTPKLSLYIFF